MMEKKLKLMEKKLIVALKKDAVEINFWYWFGGVPSLAFIH